MGDLGLHQAPSKTWILKKSVFIINPSAKVGSPFAITF